MYEFKADLNFDSMGISSKYHTRSMFVSVPHDYVYTCLGSSVYKELQWTDFADVYVFFLISPLKKKKSIFENNILINLALWQRW